MTSSDKEKPAGSSSSTTTGEAASSQAGSRESSSATRATSSRISPTRPAVSRRSPAEALLDDIASMNAQHLADYGDPEIDTRIAQYEMAFGCSRASRTSSTFRGDRSRRSTLTVRMLSSTGSYANNCLIARRLLERGVRFVQLMHAGWDQHGNLFTQLERNCKDTDAPSAALVQDLKDRGLLDDTLVVWGGEFGRTPFGQGDPGESQGAGSLRQGLQLVARRWGDQAGDGLWCDGRLRLEHCREPGPCS